MRFITIGKQGVSLFLDCSALELGSVEVYKIPLGISMPTGLEIAYGLCYGILIFALPLIYRFTRSLYYVSVALLSSVLLVLLVLRGYRQRICKDYAQWISYKDLIDLKVENFDLIIRIFRRHSVRNLLVCLGLSLFIVLSAFLGYFFLNYYDSNDYKLLLSFNAPSFLVLLWGSLKPIDTIKYYFKVKRLRK